MSMKGLSIRRFERLLGDQTIDEFVTQFMRVRSETIKMFLKGEAIEGHLKPKVDLKSAIDLLMEVNGTTNLAYSLYRAVRRYVLLKHGEPLVVRSMSIQGFYLDILITYLRLPEDFGFDDLTAYIVNHSMLLKALIDGAFPKGELNSRAYSFMYARVTRSEYVGKIQAVTGLQRGRGGKPSYDGPKSSMRESSDFEAEIRESFRHDDEEG